MLSGIAAASASAGFDRRCFESCVAARCGERRRLDIGSLDPDDIPERLDKLSELCRRNDRTLDDLWLCHKLFISIGTAQPDLRGNRKMGTGTVEEITDDLKRLRDHGYRSTIFRYPVFDIAEQNRQFDILADKIMTKI